MDFYFLGVKSAVVVIGRRRTDVTTGWATVWCCCENSGLVLRSALSHLQRLVCAERRRADPPPPPMLQLQSKAEAARRMRLERRKKLAEAANAYAAPCADGYSTRAHYNASTSGAKRVDAVNGHQVTHCSSPLCQRSEAQSRSINGAHARPPEDDVRGITSQVAKNRICDEENGNGSQVFTATRAAHLHDVTQVTVDQNKAHSIAAGQYSQLFIIP